MAETQELTGPIAKALRQLGYLVIRMQSGRIPKGRRWIYLCEEGTADLLVFRPGKPVVWIETKVSGNSTKKSRVEAQAAFAEQVTALGHLYIRAESLQMVLAVLEASCATK